MAEYFYTEKNHPEKYNQIYVEYQLLSDQSLIEKWNHHQHDIRYTNDCNQIACSVCEDLLRQRGNTYLDDTYPKD